MNVIIDINTISSIEDNTLIFFKREDLFKLLEIVEKNKFSIDPDYVTSIEVNEEHIECAYIYKSNKKYNQVFILKNVIAPYRENGKPRGWFFGLENKPQRFTGISNSLYFNSKDEDIKTKMYLLMLLQYNDNNILTESNDKYLLKAINIIKNKSFDEWTKLHVKVPSIKELENPEFLIKEKIKQSPVLQNVRVRSLLY